MHNLKVWELKTDEKRKEGEGGRKGRQEFGGGEGREREKPGFRDLVSN